jgi:hypothetical protein
LVGELGVPASGSDFSQSNQSAERIGEWLAEQLQHANPLALTQRQEAEAFAQSQEAMAQACVDAGYDGGLEAAAEELEKQEGLMRTLAAFIGSDVLNDMAGVLAGVRSVVLAKRVTT